MVDKLEKLCPNTLAHWPNINRLHSFHLLKTSFLLSSPVLDLLLPVLPEHSRSPLSFDIISPRSNHQFSNQNAGTLACPALGPTGQLRITCFIYFVNLVVALL